MTTFYFQFSSSIMGAVVPKGQHETKSQRIIIGLSSFFHVTPSVSIFECLINMDLIFLNSDTLLYIHTDILPVYNLWTYR